MPAFLAILAVAGPPVAGAQYRTFPLGEDDGLIATVRVASRASLADEDWLQIVIANTGPAGVIESARVSGITEFPNNRVDTLSALTLGAPASHRIRRDSGGNDLPEGTHTTSEPGRLAGAVLGLRDSTTTVSMHVRLELTLADGRSISTPPPGVSFTVTWAPPDAGEIASLQERAVALVRQLDAGGQLSDGDTGVLRNLILHPDTSQRITLDQVLSRLEQDQTSDTYRSIGLVELVTRRWPNDPRVIGFYRDALASRGPAALRDLAAFSGTPWDESLIEPVVQLMESAARSAPPADGFTVVSRGMSLLDRHHVSWQHDASIPPRLTAVVQRVMPAGPNAFYNTVSALAQTRDLGAIAVLRPLLADHTIDSYTSWSVSGPPSANMPVGVTPMRHRDLAANAILRLLGEPEMVSPWRRARAPAGGPYPEWEAWDAQIDALELRLDGLQAGAVQVERPWPDRAADVTFARVETLDLPETLRAALRTWDEFTEGRNELPRSLEALP